jgi:mRNA interferase RelE/StbE
MALTWQVEFDERARRDLRRLDTTVQDRILNYLRVHVATEGNPRRHGEALKGTMAGLWKYRVGDYRIVSKIQDEKVTVFVVRIGHRREIYR